MYARDPALPRNTWTSPRIGLARQLEVQPANFLPATGGGLTWPAELPHPAMSRIHAWRRLIVHGVACAAIVASGCVSLLTPAGQPAPRPAAPASAIAPMLPELPILPEPAPEVPAD